MDMLLCNGLKIFKRKVQYLEGYVDPRNIFSIKILEKSGFIKTHEEDNDYVYRKK